ncbi:MAG: beta-propeller fold lactonase family protein [Acidobacteriia bacterium]|nr:beta-propeller fold lactonase family protein [Terriglobia bacterium]
MSKKIGGVVALAGLCALSLFLVNCGSSSSRPTGVLYVLTQGSNGVGNNVSTFAMDLNSGGLSLVNSNASTCPTAATGTNPNPCGLPVDILLDPTGATAFVLDQGAPPCPSCSPDSNNPIAPAIYPYTVGSDGSLSPLGTGLHRSCGTNVSNCSDTATAMVRDAAGQFLFVIDYGSSPTPGYPTANSPYPSCPHVPTAAYDVCPSISVFTMTSGTLKEAGSPFYLSKIPSALSAITFTPPGSTSAQELLFVTNNQDICSQNCIAPSPHNDNTVSVYSVSSSGTLTEQPNSPYAVAAVNPLSVLAVNTNPAGQNSGGLFVYVGSEDSSGGHLYPFEVCTVVGSAGCTQQQVDQTLMFPLATCPAISCEVPPSPAGKSPVAMVVDPTNNFLYVASEGSSQVFAFKINTTAGTLTALSPNPNLPTGSQPVSMALHPSVNNTGQFLYTSNSGSDNISGFSLSTTSGVMSSLPAVATPAAPSGMTAR